MNVYTEDDSMYVGENDLLPRRTIKLSDGKEIIGIRHGQYGFWRLQYEHGMLPVVLKGDYLSFDRLLKDVEAHFKLKGIQIVDVKD